MNQEFNELKENARSGNPEAQYKIGALLIEGKKVKKNSEEGCKWLEVSAKSGNVHAQILLAEQYARGDGVSRSYEVALSWYSKAASQSHPDALYRMGILMIYAKKDPDSISKGEGFIRDAALKGNINAQYELGIIYLRGKTNINTDYEEAIRWLKEAAEKEHLPSLNELGYLYAKGTPDKKIKPNEQAAIKYWQIAADKGLAEAEYNLANLFVNIAIKLWEKSATKGFPKSKYMLSVVKNYDWKD
tara:strand:+ start:153 stop:887 length:735 start_codon:yes stop_codon:yes gene_type:complete